MKRIEAILWATLITIPLAFAACDDDATSAAPGDVVDGDIDEDAGDTTGTAPQPPRLVGTTPLSPAKSTTPTVNGTARPGATVRLYADPSCQGAPVGQAQVAIDEAFAIEVSVAENSGTVLTADAMVDGRVSGCSAPLTYVADNLPPNPPLISACDPSPPANQNIIMLRGSAEPQTMVRLYATAACDGDAMAEVASDALLDTGIEVDVEDDTETVFHAVAVDAAGNVSPCSSPGFTYVEDSTPPSAPQVLETIPGSPADDEAPVVVGAAEADTLVRLFITEDCSGEPLAEGLAETFAEPGLSIEVPADGAHGIRAVAVDAAGNVSGCSEPLVYVEDSTGPDAPVFLSPAGPTSDPAPAIGGTAEPGAIVQLHLGLDCAGDAVGAGTADDAGVFSIAGPTLAANAQNELSARAYDGLGHSSPCSQMILTHDDVPPAIPSFKNTDPPLPMSTGDSLTVYGVGEVPGAIDLFAGDACEGAPVATALVQTFGNFQAVVTVTPNSVNLFSAHATDVAGNVSGCSLPLEVVHDAEPPTFGGPQAAKALGTDAIEVTWSIGSDNLAAQQQLSYEVCAASADEPGACQPWQTSVSVAGIVGKATVSGLQPNTRYTLWVHAVDQAGNPSPDTPPVVARTHGDRASVDVTVGSAHACALVGDGAVRCWGDNSFGQLGNNTGQPSVQPTPVPGLTQVVSLAAGTHHTCAVQADGDTYCWGDNASDQVAAGQGPFVPVAAKILVAPPAVAAAAGAEHSCVIATDGKVYCWGDGESGQLGDGNAADSPTPVEVVGITDARAIAAGDYHTCAVLGSGALKCWGEGEAGQLGHSVFGSSPVPVTADLLEPVLDVSAGDVHTCARTAVGHAWCWGNGKNGQLSGTGGNASKPQQVLMVLIGSVPLSDVVDIAVGAIHSCALRANGVVHCWGTNLWGQLGYGNDNAASLAALETLSTDTVALSAGGQGTCAVSSQGKVSCWGRNDFGQLGSGTPGPMAYSNQPAPAVVTGTQTGRRLVAGRFFNASLMSDGTLRTWGINDQGQLANGGVSVDGVATPTPPEDAGAVVDVDLGRDHGCLVRANGDVACWGADTDAQLGDGPATAPAKTPVDLTGMPRATSVAAGERHTCVRHADGTASCWGANAAGQLGLGTTETADAPQLVPGLTDVLQLAAGKSFTCALLGTGEVTCWGAGAAGQLGDGAQAAEMVPGASFVSGVASAVQIEAGEAFACAREAAGQLKCWGSNDVGQIGDGLAAPGAIQPVAKAVPDVDGVRTFDAGWRHVCAADWAGAVSCWGAGTSGQLGQGAPQDEPSPVPVAGVLAPLAIGAGWNHTCVLQSDGKLRCFGGNQSGQLGPDAPLAGTTTPSLVLAWP